MTRGGILERRWCVGITGVVLLASVTSAGAERRRPKRAHKPASPAAAAPSSKDTDAGHPWAKGVSSGDQQQALAFYEAGNRYFAEAKYSQAIAEYRQAIGFWDHPAIRFNMAVSLINLDQPLVAHEHLEAALRYGAAPLDDRIYRDGLTYRKLLLGRLAMLEVECSEDEAQVTLDGRVLFTAPGKVEQLVLPGSHEIVGKKEGYLTRSERVIAVPGQKNLVELRLATLESSVEMRRPLKKWIPWAVAGTGAALALLGVPLYIQARADFDAYDRDVEILCPGGCPESDLPAATRDHESRGRLVNAAAVALLASGGVAIATSLALILYNRPRAVLSDEARGGRERRSSVRLLPLPGGAAGTISWTF